MDPTLYNVFLCIAAVFIAVGFLLLAWRVIVGPDSMDLSLIHI